MPEPRRPTQDELLNKLLNSEDDRPWKLAVSYILGDIIAENRDLEEGRAHVSHRRRGHLLADDRRSASGGGLYPGDIHMRDAVDVD